MRIYNRRFTVRNCVIPVAVFAMAILAAGCGGGGGGGRVATPQLTGQGASKASTATIESQLLVASGAGRVAPRVSDPFLSRIPANTKQTLEIPSSGYEPLSDATITADLDGNSFETKSDENGNWKATNVPEGTQNFTVSKGGKSVTVPITVTKDKEHKNLAEITEDETGGWQAETQTIHGDGTDGYKKEGHASGTSDTVFENGVRDHHKTSGYTDRDENDDGIVDKRFIDTDDDGQPDGPVMEVGGDTLDDLVTADPSYVDNEPPEIKSISAKDSKGKKKNTVLPDDPLTLEADIADADADNVSVKWTVTDIEGNDVTDLFLDADDIVAPTFSPPHGEFEKPGAYFISVDADDGNGGSSGKDMIISLETEDNKSPQVHIKASPTTGEAPLTVDFECVAKDIDGSIVSYCWDFDKSNGIDQDDCDDTVYKVTKTFVSPGKYRTTCIVTDDQGAVNFAKRVIIVRKGNVKPEITRAEPDKTTVEPGEDVTIDISTTDPDGDEVEVEVDAPCGTFKDSDASDGQVTWSPPAEGGECVIEIIATDEQGEKTREQVKISVEPGDNLPPQIDATATPAEGESPLTVTFTCDASDPDGTIGGIEWDFDPEDGFQAEKTGDTVTVKFGAPGEYTGTAKVCDDDGACAYDRVTVVVEDPNDPPTVEAYVSDSNVSSGQQVSLTADAFDPDNDSLTYTWQVDGGTVADSDEALTAWTVPDEPGAYTATVTVSDGVNPPVTSQVTVNVTLPGETPDPPESCRAVGKKDAIEVYVDESPDEDVESYKLYRDAGDGFEYVQELPADEDLEYEDTDVAPGTEYCYRVTAVGENGMESAPAEESCASPDPNVKDIEEVGEDPGYGIYFPGRNKVYIVNEGDGTVSVIDASTDEKIRDITVGDQPVGACADEDAGLLYVTNAGDDTVSVIDTATDTVIDTISVPGGPSSCVVDSGDGDVYTGNRDDDTVVIIDRETRQIKKLVPVDEYPCVCGIDDSSGGLYVTNRNSNTVTIIDTVEETVKETVVVGQSPRGCALNKTTHEVYIVNRNDNTVTIIDTSPGNEGDVKDTITLPPSDSGPDCSGCCPVNESTNNIYISNRNSNTVTLIDGSSHTVSDSLPVQDDPGCLALDASGGSIYICNTNRNVVTIVDDPSPGIPWTEQPPYAPPACYATGKSGAVELSWDEPSGGTIPLKYNIYRAQMTSGQWGSYAKIAEDASLSRAYEDTSVQNGNRYRYKVTAAGSSGIEGPACPAVPAVPDGDVEDVVPIGENPGKSLYCGPCGGYLYVVNRNDNSVSIVNPGTGQEESRVPVGRSPSGMCAPDDFSEIYITNENSNTISVIDTTTNSVSATYSLSGGPSGCAFNDKTDEIYVSLDLNDTIAIIDRETMTKEAELPSEDGSDVCGCDPDTGYVFITNTNENTLAVIDGTTRQTAGTVAVGNGPSGCAVSSVGNSVFIANRVAEPPDDNIAAGGRPGAGLPVGMRRRRIHLPGVHHQLEQQHGQYHRRRDDDGVGLRGSGQRAVLHSGGRVGPQDIHHQLEQQFCFDCEQPPARHPGRGLRSGRSPRVQRDWEERSGGAYLEKRHRRGGLEIQRLQVGQTGRELGRLHKNPRGYTPFHVLRGYGGGQRQRVQVQDDGCRGKRARERSVPRGTWNSRRRRRGRRAHRRQSRGFGILPRLRLPVHSQRERQHSLGGRPGDRAGSLRDTGR